MHCFVSWSVCEGMGKEEEKDSKQCCSITNVLLLEFSENIIRTKTTI